MRVELKVIVVCVCVCMCVCVCTHMHAGAKSQVCLTLCDPMGCSPPGSSVCWISQARRLEWVAFPSPGDLPDPGIKPTSLGLLHCQVDSSPLRHLGSPTDGSRGRNC